MITSSPGPAKQRIATSIASLPPTVTSTCESCSYLIPNLRSIYLVISSLKIDKPLFGVYQVLPSCSEEIPSSLTCQGVLKSGSPTEREITLSISAAISKNFLIPDGLTETILLLSTFE